MQRTTRSFLNKQMLRRQFQTNDKPHFRTNNGHLFRCFNVNVSSSLSLVSRAKFLIVILAENERVGLRNHKVGGASVRLADKTKLGNPNIVFFSKRISSTKNEKDGNKLECDFN